MIVMMMAIMMTSILIILTSVLIFIKFLFSFILTFPFLFFLSRLWILDLVLSVLIRSTVYGSQRPSLQVNRIRTRQIRLLSLEKNILKTFILIFYFSYDLSFLINAFFSIYYFYSVVISIIIVLLIWILLHEFIYSYIYLFIDFYTHPLLFPLYFRHPFHTTSPTLVRTAPSKRFVPPSLLYGCDDGSTVPLCRLLSEGLRGRC